jgi:hypothetical protein
VIGLPLNLFVTINFQLTGCSDEAVSSTFRRLLAERFAPWLRRTLSARLTCPPTYVWTLEAANSQMALHWLVHVPPRAQPAFKRALSQWLDGLVGDLEAGAVDVRRLYNLIRARRYALKGINPVWAPNFGVRPVCQGKVYGKRSGFSRNLGPAARKRGGYKPRRPRGQSHAAASLSA